MRSWTWVRCPAGKSCPTARTPIASTTSAIISSIRVAPRWESAGNGALVAMRFLLGEDQPGGLDADRVETAAHVLEDEHPRERKPRRVVHAPVGVQDVDGNGAGPPVIGDAVGEGPLGRDVTAVVDVVVGVVAVLEEVEGLLLPGGDRLLARHANLGRHVLDRALELLGVRDAPKSRNAERQDQAEHE